MLHFDISIYLAFYIIQIYWNWLHIWLLWLVFWSWMEWFSEDLCWCSLIRWLKEKHDTKHTKIHGYWKVLRRSFDKRFSTVRITSNKHIFEGQELDITLWLPFAEGERNKNVRSSSEIRDTSKARYLIVSKQGGCREWEDDWVQRLKALLLVGRDCRETLP